MESQPRNPEFRNNPENFHPCVILTFPVRIHTVHMHFRVRSNNKAPDRPACIWLSRATSALIVPGILGVDFAHFFSIFTFSMLFVFMYSTCI